jgi:hypothetical protein
MRLLSVLFGVIFYATIFGGGIFVALVAVEIAFLLTFILFLMEM